MSDRREDLDDPEVAMLAALEGLQARMWTAMPGIVVAVNLAAQTCSVQPSIQGVFTDRENIPRNVNMPVLLDVPIVYMRAGGFAVTVPLAPGDEVLVVFGSRAIDSWWQNGGIGAPVEARMHDLSDGFAIPGPTSQPRRLPDVQTDGVELRTEDRSVFLKLTASGIQIQGDIVHVGNTTQTGNTTSSGTITGATNVVGGGKSLATHVHSGVQSGPNNTGAPV